MYGWFWWAQASLPNPQPRHQVTALMTGHFTHQHFWHPRCLPGLSPQADELERQIGSQCASDKGEVLYYRLPNTYIEKLAPIAYAAWLLSEWATGHSPLKCDARHRVS